MYRSLPLLLGLAALLFLAPETAFGQDGGAAGVTSEDSGGDTLASGNGAVRQPVGLEGDANGQPQPGMFDFLTRGPLGIMLIALAAFYFMVVLPQQRSMKRQQAERAEALLNMKKNDRVVTAGGIHGVVVSVNKDEKTVTIRTDESTNSRLTINSDSVTIVDLTATKTD